jgi:mono/diheme cytochrome c family protein
MRRLVRALAALGLALVPVLGSADSPSSQVQRGQYLAVAGDCTACHTAPGGAFLAGGVPLQTPFGRLVPPNITPDPTGIGGWTDAQFIRAMRHGIAPGWKHLYPGFPYVYFTKISDSDLTALHDYLNTVKPVSHAVVANQLPFPYDIRASMIGWNLLFFAPGRFKPDARQSEVWNRGAYLVEAPGHCGACHTPKNFLGADKESRYLQGGLLGGWYAPDLTGNPRTGLGKWSVQDIADYLRTGHNAEDSAAGPMADVVMNSTAFMTPQDLQAIAVYLKSQPSYSDTAAAVAVPASAPAMQAGAKIYQDNCAMCHAPDGSGVTRLFPPLAGNAVVQSPDPATVIRVVLQGIQSSYTSQAPTGLAMPTFGWKLSDAQVADVTTYIRNAWGNVAPAVTETHVDKARKQLGKSQ